MNEYTDNDSLAIVLSIIEGTGFNARKTPIIIRAILGGNTLETDAAVPGDLTTVFKNNLIWSTNKEAIKRMKEENQPIKVECFMQSSENDRKLIGFVLLPMRRIPFWTSRKSSTMKSHWYKLLGVSQEFKLLKPELLLCVSIGDKNVILNDTEKLVSHLLPDDNDIIDRDEQEPSADINILKSQAGLTVKLLENNYIQIDSDSEGSSDQHEFIVKIHIKMVELDERFGDKLLLTYFLFRNIQFELNRNTATDHFLIDECIVITFKSSLEDLVDYFRKIFYLPIVVYHEDKAIGSTQLTFGDSLSALPTSISDFEQIFASEELTYSFDDFSKLIASTNEQNEHVNSNIHFSFSLTFVRNVLNQSNLPNLAIPSSPKDNKLSSIDSTRCKNSDIVAATNELTGIDSVRANYLTDLAKPIPRTFSYTLTLIDCTFTRRPYPGIWQLSLQHPEADTALAIRNIEITEIVVEQISFEDLHLRLCFSTHANRLLDVIKSKSCLLTLKGPRGVHATAELDNENILAQMKTKGIVLLENEQNDQVAMAHISVEIGELGINFNAQENSEIKRHLKSTQQPSFAILNEDLAYKMIEELEDWKQSQQNAFLAELKRKEISHLTCLSNEWQRKCRERELCLRKKIDHCDWLTKTLEEAHLTLKERNRADADYEQQLLKAKCEMERSFAKKMDSLHGHIKLLEQEKLQQSQAVDATIKELESDRNRLMREIDKLRAKIRLLEKEIRMEDDIAITHDEVVAMQRSLKFLSDELETTKKSKLLYKEKWAQMVREVQKIKLKNENLDDAEYTNHPRLNDLINSARKDLCNEQSKLNEINDRMLSNRK